MSYSVVLTAQHDGVWHTVRVYDNAHNENEFHRHTLLGGKQPAERFLPGDPGAAMRAARAEVLARYDTMIEAWRS